MRTRSRRTLADHGQGLVSAQQRELIAEATDTKRDDYLDQLRPRALFRRQAAALVQIILDEQVRREAEMLAVLAERIPVDAGASPDPTGICTSADEFARYAA